MTTEEITFTRKCTICGDAFHYRKRPGRPPAFCSATCKRISTGTRTRQCISCDSDFTLENNPFYCPACDTDTKRRTCATCGTPCTERWCSHACLQKQLPPPYKCIVCDCEFTPTDWWYDKPVSLNEAPKFCGAYCYENRTIALGRPSPNVVQEYEEFRLAIDSYVRFGGALPLRRNGMPFTRVRIDDMQTIDLPPREQNAVNFWRWAVHPCETLQPVVTKDLMAEYLAYGAFTRGLMGPDTRDGIQRVWRLWPWIIYDMGRLPTGPILRFLQTYNRVMNMRRNYLGAKNRTDLMGKLQRAEGIFTTWQGLTESDADFMKEQSRFINTWMKPQEAFGGRTKLQVECELFLKAQAQPEISAWMPHLTKPQQRLILKAHDDLNAKAVEAQQRKTKALPWGPRLTNDIFVMEDRFMEVLHSVVTGGLQVTSNA